MPKQRRHEMGVGGYCICPKCDEKIEHRDGIPCQDEKCPSCGETMLREDSHQHKQLKENENK